jgi:hypothetical protein
MEKRKHPERGSTLPNETQNGLVLDDYLSAIAEVRKRFKLGTPSFRLRKVGLYPRAKSAVETIVDLVIRQHGTSIFTKPHPLIADLGDGIYADRVVTPVYTGYRVHPKRRKDVLLGTVEIGLQTITQLPSRYPAAAPPQKQLKSLAESFAKAADVANIAMGQEEVRKRIELFFGNEDESQRRLLRAFNELGWCAGTLDGISRLKVRRLSLDSRNPQVSLALYVVNWFEASTGSKQYGGFVTLLEGAFDAAKLSAPRWVDRLAIEMHARRRRRQEWMARIST